MSNHFVIQNLLYNVHIIYCVNEMKFVCFYKFLTNLNNEFAISVVSMRIQNIYILTHYNFIVLFLKILNILFRFCDIFKILYFNTFVNKQSGWTIIKQLDILFLLTCFTSSKHNSNYSETRSFAFPWNDTYLFSWSSCILICISHTLPYRFARYTFLDMYGNLKTWCTLIRAHDQRITVGYKIR